MLGEATIELADILEDVSLIKAPLSLNKKYFEDVMKPKYPQMKMQFDESNPNKLYLTLWSKNKKGKLEKRGQVGI